MPISAAMLMVSRREQASHRGGCGRCRGLGTTLRGGIDRNGPSCPLNGSSVMQRRTTSRPSRHAARFSSIVMSNPPSSTSVPDSPEPNSTRPLDRRSSVATRSAVRAGWLYCGAVWMMPWPIRMFFVRWLTAARNTSGAEEWEYSSRKWCSVCPDVVEAQLVRELDLLQGVLEQSGTRCPRSRACGSV